MSSHHVVRDLQEPALILANGSSCSSELLGQLLEWSPFTLVLDGAIDRAAALGIRIDAWLGDFDSGKEESYHALSALQPVRKIEALDEDKTDLQKGVEWLMSEGHKAVNILWATGKRTDHTVHNLLSLVAYSDRINWSILDDHSRVFALGSRFRKWYPKGTALSLIPVGTAMGVSSQNLVWELEQLDLAYPHRSGSSNRVKTDGFVEISKQSGHLLLMECWD
ncbi:MAG: thiamine diphosphokinase [Bacteroidia bacterium]